MEEVLDADTVCGPEASKFTRRCLFESSTQHSAETWLI